MKNLKLLLMSLFVIVTVSHLQAQNLSFPRPSQQATIIQRLGLSDVTIKYHSPGVKGRQVLGGIVPYGNIWRAGANENTTIHFTHNAIVEGQKIAAGTYGLYMIPNKSEFKILFSKFNTSWGTVNPKEEDVVLEITVTPEEIPFQEWLSYNFKDRGAKSLTAVLQWEKLRIPFKIEFDIDAVVMDYMQSELRGISQFTWSGFSDAAAYLNRNNIHLDQAMIWIDKSLSGWRNFINLQTKASLLIKLGKNNEAKEILVELIPLTKNPNGINAIAYLYMNDLKDPKKAIEVLKDLLKNYPNHPFIWGYTDTLGEAYLKDGNKKMALKYYKIAKSIAPENQQEYFDGVIAGIKN